MTRRHLSIVAVGLGAALAVATPAFAEPGPEGNHGGSHGGGRAAASMHPAEPERGPQGYQRIERPAAVAARPQQFDRQAYNHNFNADHGYHIGPYHAPRGFAYRRWSYGQVLPRIYWGQQYWLSDYWLFGLDVPPVGFEWVRFGPDALLIDTNSGEVIQVVYGRFL